MDGPIDASAGARRVAMISVHTSPLDTPGSGDAGGLNVYVRQSADHLAALGVEVDVFTRARSAADPPVVQASDGVRVHHVAAGPYEGLVKDDLPAQICAFAAGVTRAMAARPEGFYDVVHSHYWLSGRVAMLAADRWALPVVHTMHTMARVKNRGIAAGDAAEPPVRERGEAQIVARAAALVANTDLEARELVDLYAADPARVHVVPPGVDLDAFTPGDAATRAADRALVGLGADDLVVLFVGRIQRLKGPDVLLRAAAHARDHLLSPADAARLRVVVLGGPSGGETATPGRLRDLAARLGVADVTLFVDPVPQPELARWYRAADVVAVPSHNESFGLVAIEAQACGTPVLAAAVGGLRTAVGGGVLVDGHDPERWAADLAALLGDPERRAALGARGVEHASGFGWGRTASRLLDVYGEAMRSVPVAAPRPRSASPNRTSPIPTDPTDGGRR